MFLTDMKKTVEHTKIIAFQQPLRPAPPEAIGPEEYREYRETLIEMDRILDFGVEQDFILNKMEHENHPPSGKIQNKYNNIRKAFRYVLLKSLTGDSSRELSIRVCDSRLFRWFISFDMTSKKGGSKSAIDRYEKLFTEEEITDLIHTINQSVSVREQAQRLILEDELDFSRHWVDSTCIKADIHFPVDWVLLHDSPILNWQYRSNPQPWIKTQDGEPSGFCAIHEHPCDAIHPYREEEKRHNSS